MSTSAPNVNSITLVGHLTADPVPAVAARRTERLRHAPGGQRPARPATALHRRRQLRRQRRRLRQVPREGPCDRRHRPPVYREWEADDGSKRSKHQVIGRVRFGGRPDTDTARGRFRRRGRRDRVLSPGRVPAAAVAGTPFLVQLNPATEHSRERNQRHHHIDDDIGDINCAMIVYVTAVHVEVDLEAGTVTAVFVDDDSVVLLDEPQNLDSRETRRTPDRRTQKLAGMANRVLTQPTCATDPAEDVGVAPPLEAYLRMLAGSQPQDRFLEIRAIGQPACPAQLRRGRTATSSPPHASASSPQRRRLSRRRVAYHQPLWWQAGDRRLPPRLHRVRQHCRGRQRSSGSSIRQRWSSRPAPPGTCTSTGSYAHHTPTTWSRRQPPARHHSTAISRASTSPGSSARPAPSTTNTRHPRPSNWSPTGRPSAIPSPN